jgi:hypothetical protein
VVFKIGTNDPLTFVSMAALLTFTALAACWRPARRASRVNPIPAMRTEQVGRGRWRGRGFGTAREPYARLTFGSSLEPKVPRYIAPGKFCNYMS